MAKIVSAKDVEAAAQGGQKSVGFGPGAIITAAARDRARELGLTIDANSAGSAVATMAPPAAPRQSVAPAAAAAPAAPAAEERRGSPSYFDNVVIDNLMNITLELGAAVWVVKDRLRVVEELLEQRGVVTQEMIEMYRPDPSRERDLRARRDSFIDKIYKSVRENPG